MANETTQQNTMGMPPDALRALLFQLSGIGGALSAGKPVGEEIGRTNQQAIQAQQFKDLLPQFLGQQGNKISLDAKGVNITSALGSFQQLLKMFSGEGEGVLDKEIGASGLGAPGLPQEIPAAAAPTTPATPAAPATGRAVLPFSSSPIVDPGLVGLTPRDVAIAVGLGQRQEELRQRESARIERGQAAVAAERGRESRAATGHALERSRLRLATIGEARKIYKDLEPAEASATKKLYDEMGGKKGTGVTLEQFYFFSKDSDFAAWQSYQTLEPEDAAELGFSGFKLLFSDANARLYRQVVKEETDAGREPPTRREWAKELRKASAGQTTVNIGEKSEARARGTVRGRTAAEFKTPGYRQEVYDSVLTKREARHGNILEENLQARTDSYWNRIEADLVSRFGAGNISFEVTERGVIATVNDAGRAEVFEFSAPNFPVER